MLIKPVLRMNALINSSLKLGEPTGDQGMGLFISGYPNVNLSGKI
jgi:hypothetical protein